MSLAARWNDLEPAKRCDWIDQLRGWAILVMIEVHCVNVWLLEGLRPGWLDYVNGLVAPSFLVCAGFSLVLSTFRPDGTLRPFRDSAGRLGIILLCAYALHAPGFALADWTVLSTPQKLRELFKIDVLQCIVFSLLILQGLARLVRRPAVFTGVALLIALHVALVSPHLGATGVADGLWLPIRGLFNTNPDRGVQALFPLFPWLAFPAFGAFLGGLYRWKRVERGPGGQAPWSELRWLAALAGLGAVLALAGALTKQAWVWEGEWVAVGSTRLLNGIWLEAELVRIHNATLPSIAERLGCVCLAGVLAGLVEQFRPRWKGANLLAAASRESLLIYMFHLFLIFSLLLTPAVVGLTGWDWHTLGWAGTLPLTAAVIAASVGAGFGWQWLERRDDLKNQVLRWAGATLAVWFLLGNWWTFRFLVHSPELAPEPYPFLNASRVKKGLSPTPDGLSRDAEEVFREAARRKIRLSETRRRVILKQIEARRTADGNLPVD